MERLKIDPLSTWGLPNKRPLVISGPCSAESEEQVLETAKRLDGQGIDILRAGIWKPRTRPGSFEGVGRIALPWLKKAGEQLGKPIAVEVATREHVFDCLKAGVDILWVGARTTANPFSVQEIADALEGVDIPVIVKNPVNPDLQLWIGALERINRAGITRLGALHRGFSSYDKSK
ncbi:MAG TPA: 3-deoxy-7-phosphoheptulonate synthase, partial [Chitinophagales bacterium]|nr:3-deoxy-7-phosphoheptulonate synthase [Chitinophagales bacterium]